MFEDDYEFTPSSNSKLSSLFRSSENSPEKSQNPLFYKAPKETKKQEPVNNSPNASTFVVIAKVIHAWKLVENKYSLLGKLGIAIIGSPTQTTEMILYKERKNVIVRVQLTSLFQVTLKKDNFISFYNSDHENFLVRFNNDEDFFSVVGEFEKIGVDVSHNRKSLEKTSESEKNQQNDDEHVESKAKSDILNRIAKMGQSILPNGNNQEENSDESEIDSNSSKLVPVQVQHQQIPSSSVIVNAAPPQQPPQIVSFDPFALLCAETRTQNSEVRVNLSQISEKLNQILHIVDKAPSEPSTETASLKSRIKVLELRCENLTSALAREKTLEHSTNNAKSLQKTVEKLEEQVACLEREQLANVVKFEEKIEADTRIIADLNKTVELQLSEISLLRKNEESGLLKSEVLELHGKISELESKLETAKKCESERNGRIVDVLKEEMNMMFSSIVDSFSGEERSFSSKEIQSSLARNIKITTRRVIGSIQQEAGDK